ALLIPLGVVCFLLWDFVFGRTGDAVVAFLLGMEAAVALAVGVAVTRYRLYEIDRLINRTLVYTVLTASLGLVYAVVSLLAGVARARGRRARPRSRSSRPECRAAFPAACERCVRRSPRNDGRRAGRRRARSDEG